MVRGTGRGLGKCRARSVDEAGGAGRLVAWLNWSKLNCRGFRPTAIHSRGRGRQSTETQGSERLRDALGAGDGHQSPGGADRRISVSDLDDELVAGIHRPVRLPVLAPEDRVSYVDM